ncbi:glycosyltransferase family 2 protein [Candidatus Altiarchaeota archaeon]
MDGNPKIAVSLIMWDLGESGYLKEALDSLMGQTYENIEVFFTLNGMDPQVAEKILADYPATRMIIHEENTGFAYAHKHAMNLAFNELGFDAVIVLNLDVVLALDCIERLAATAYADDSIGLAQPTIFMWRDGKSPILNTDGNKAHFLGFGYCGHYGLKGPLTDQDGEVPTVSGTCFLIKEPAFQATLGLDEDLFIYLDDVDLSWRSRLEGFSCYLSSKAFMWHKHDFGAEFSSSKKMYLLERNRYILLLKNYSLKTLILLLPGLLLMDAGVLFYSIVKGFVSAKVRSYFGIASQLRSTLRKRALIQGSRQTSDAGILSWFTAEMVFPHIDHPLLDLANRMFRIYYGLIRRFV